MPKPEALVDTGALLALLSPVDRWHTACVDAFSSLRLPLVTSTAVLTELFHLVGSHGSNSEEAWRLVRSGAILVQPVGHDDLAELDALMSRYRDRPMDLADATLVLLARRASLTTIFTIDHDDFETYRIERRKKFRIVPDRWRGGR